MREIGDGELASDLVHAVVDSQSVRFNRFITNFIHGFSESQLELHKWILGATLVSDIDQLETGLPYSELRVFLDEYHPEEVNAGPLTQALRSTAALQVNRLSIKPIILDYDQSGKRLTVVDRSFLIWLKHQEVEELLKLAELPRNFVRQWLASRVASKHHHQG